MPMFVLKPVPVEAIQLNADNLEAIRAFMPHPWFCNETHVDADGMETVTGELLGLRVKMSSSEIVLAIETYWIVKNPDNTFSVLTNTAFTYLYEAAP